MAEDRDTIAAEASQAFLAQLERLGFFEQLKKLEGSLTALAGELTSIGEREAQRREEIDNLAAHVLALQSLLAVMVRSHPVDRDAVEREVETRTEVLTGDAGGSATVRAIALKLVDDADG